MSAEDAFLKYSAKQLKKNNPRAKKKRNDKPEEVAVKEITEWCRKNNWSMHRVESKAVYSASAGRYLRGQVTAGYPDLSGNTDKGLAVYVEVKAKGKRKSIKAHQIDFLRDKIRTGCFAICADSAEFIGNCWIVYSALNDALARKYLNDLLDNKRF